MSQTYIPGKPRDLELTELVRNAMGLYGCNINLQRSIPLLADGLKPSHRRILFCLYKNHKENLVKVAVASGEYLTITPHSDMGLNKTYAGLAQTFSNNVPLLKAHGNSGTPTQGDDCAASRYWECGLSKFAMDILFSEFDGKVNMKPSYDGSTQEPIALPAKFPIVLLNGSSGIGYTMSSDIPSFNLNEIADETLKLLKNPDAKIKLIPDSPTGCDIIIVDKTHFIYQSSFDIDNVNYMITIKNTPYKSYLFDIDKALCKIQDSDNPIKEIISADDESELMNGKIRYVIRCKPCNLYAVVNKLFKRVPGFKVGITTTNMLVVDNNFKINQYDTRQILLAWINNRLVEKRNWFLRDLVAKTTERNMLEGKAFMLSKENLETTILVFKACKTRADIIPNLVKAFKGQITTSQADYISDAKLYQLTIEEYNKTINKIKDLTEKIDYVKSVIDDPEKIKNVIADDIREIKQKYGYPRRSKIINTNDGDSPKSVGVVQILTDGSILFSETETPEHLSSDVTPVSSDSVCLIDDKARFLWVDTNKVEHDKPMTLTSIGRSVMSKCVSMVSNPDNKVLILSNKGRIKCMPINRIPANSSKKPLVPLDSDEYIVSVLELRDESQDILVYTSDGMGKRIQTSDLNQILSVDAQGQFIVKDVFNVSGMFCINPKKPYLVYVTQLGRMRVNNAKFLTSGKKYADLKPIISLSQQDDLVALFCVDKNQTVTLTHADSRITSVNVDSLDISTMAIPPKRPKHVPGVKVIRATIS